VVRIVMDPEAVSAAASRELGLFSKFDRDLALKNALVEHGRLQATNFLALRAERDRLCAELAQALEQSGTRPGRGRAGAAAWRPGNIFGGLLSPDVLTLDRAPGVRQDGAAPTKVRVLEAALDIQVLERKGALRAKQGRQLADHHRKIIVGDELQVGQRERRIQGRHGLGGVHVGGGEGRERIIPGLHEESPHAARLVDEYLGVVDVGLP
jgi:hypothetical protein